MDIPESALLTVLVCLAMAAVATGLLWWAQARFRLAPLISIARAGLQLLLLAMVLQLIISEVWWVFAWLAVMLTVAVLTSSRSIGWSGRVIGAVALAMTAGVTVSVVLAFITGTVDFGPQYLLAIGGIIIGNSMSVSTLSARRMREQLRDHRDEVEGWLALGAPPRVSTLRFRAESVRLALTPGIDAAKTTGLVTLPGAFTGAVFAGASPMEAGLFQIVVLASILLTSAITAVLLTELLGSPRQLPAREAN